MYCQQQFKDYYEEIKISDEKAGLREKRTILLDALKAGLPDDAPSWTHFNQGSYAMNTGVMPLDGNYDIDVGIVFDMDTSDYTALEIKKQVFSALNKGNRSVEIKYPCVRVNYMKNGEVDFHVDLAIYCQENDQYYIAKGKNNSEEDEIFWEVSSPKELIDWVYDRFSGDDRNQFLRVVSYLKRWRDLKLSHSNLPSIALTVFAGQYFVPNHDVFNDNKPRDLLALKNLAEMMKNKLDWNMFDIILPVSPRSSLLSKLTQQQKENLKDQLEGLISVLNEAQNETDTHKACKKLAKQFGDEFPVPEADSAKSYTPRSVTVTGSSA